MKEISKSKPEQSGYILWEGVEWTLSVTIILKMEFLFWQRSLLGILWVLLGNTIPNIIKTTKYRKCLNSHLKWMICFISRGHRDINLFMIYSSFTWDSVQIRAWDIEGLQKRNSILRLSSLIFVLCCLFPNENKGEWSKWKPNQR